MTAGKNNASQRWGWHDGAGRGRGRPLGPADRGEQTDTRTPSHSDVAHSFSGQGDVSIPFEDWNLHQLQVFYDAENFQIQVSACPLRMGHIFSQDAGQWWQVSKTLLMVDKE